MRFAIASSYGLSGREVERAHERGIRAFFWGALRHGDFGDALARIAKRRRDDVELITVSYATHAPVLRASVELARRKLRVDAFDTVVIGYVHGAVGDRLRDAAIALRERGVVRAIAVSSHERPLLAELAQARWTDGVMARYSAAHRGAECEVFPYVGAKRLFTYTSTRWGTLLDPSRTPAGEMTPTATDCYRFVLSNPRVDRVIVGPGDARELDGVLEAERLGAMSDEQLAWMRRVGDAVRASAKDSAPAGDRWKRMRDSIRSLVTRGVTEDVISRWNR